MKKLFNTEVSFSYTVCSAGKNWPSQLDEYKPDVVVMLVGAWDILDRQVDGQLVKFGSVQYDTSFLQQLDDATTLLQLLYSMILVSYAVNIFKQPRIPDSGSAFFDMVAEPPV